MCSEKEINFLAAICARTVVAEHDLRFKTQNPAGQIKVRRKDNSWAGITQSVQRLATGCTVLGSNPRRGEIFHTRSDRPTQPPIK